MSVDRSIREVTPQPRYQFFESLSLGTGAGIGRLHRSVAPADVTHAYRPAIVAEAMRTLNPERPPYLDFARKTDDEMIAYVGEAPLQMPPAYVTRSDITSRRRGRAMHYYLVDLPPARINRRHGLPG